MSEKSKSGIGGNAGSGFGSKTGTSSARPKATIDLEAKDVTSEKGGSSAGSSGSAKKENESATSSERPRTKPNIKSAKEVLTGQTPTEEKKDKAASSQGTKTKAKSTKADNDDSSGGGLGQSMGYLAASVAGGFVALFGAAYGLNWADTGGPFTHADRMQFERRMDTMEKSFAKVKEVSASDALVKQLDGLRAEVETAKSRLVELAKEVAELAAQPRSASSAGASGSAIEVYEQRIASLESLVRGIQAGAAGSDSINLSVLEAKLDGKIAALKDELAVSSSAGSGAAAQGGNGSSLVNETLLEETGKMRVAVDKIREQASRSEYDVGTLKSRTDLIDSDVKSLRAEASKLNSVLSNLRQEIDGVRKEAGKVEAVAAEVSPLAGRLSKLEDDLSGVLSRETNAQADARKTALAVALSNLKRVVERGEAYDKELEVVAKLSPAGLSFDKLQNYSTVGVEPPTKLERSFSAAARSAIDADAAPKDASLVSSFLANARSVVRVRRTGDVPGDSTEAVIARMEMRVKEGNLSAALKEGQGLKGLAREAADPWLSRVSARLAVNEAMKQVETELIAALGGGGSNRPEGEKQ